MAVEEFFGETTMFPKYLQTYNGIFMLKNSQKHTGTHWLNVQEAK